MARRKRGSSGTRWRLFIFEGSGHFPMIEERERYRDLLIDVVSKESQGR
jgi:hypothetical protein